MTSRSGEPKKHGQKYQNTFKFKHNKNSKLTRQIQKTPLDNLCQRCLEILEWKIDYRKYKPLTTPGRCNICQQKSIYKAYRTICDTCALKPKLCTKCAEPTEEYAEPKNYRNRVKVDDKTLERIMAVLKERQRRTVERKIQEGEELMFDEDKGIVNENGEIIVELKYIVSDFIKGNKDEDEDDESDEDCINDKENDKEKKEEVIDTKKEVKLNDSRDG